MLRVFAHAAMTQPQSWSCWRISRSSRASTSSEARRCWNGREKHIVASDYGDSQGPPVLFGKGAFDRLCELGGDHGARKVIQSGVFDVATIAVGSLGFDIDTPLDLKAASQLLSAEK